MGTVWIVSALSNSAIIVICRLSNNINCLFVFFVHISIEHYTHVEHYQAFGDYEQGIGRGVSSTE